MHQPLALVPRQIGTRFASGVALVKGGLRVHSVGTIFVGLASD
jgi:hypothetical protein